MNVYDRPVVKLFLKHGFQVVGVKEGDIVSEQAAQQKEKKPGYARPWAEIYQDLRKPIPDNMLETREQAGQTLTYIPWNNAARMLHYYAPGWGISVNWISRTDDEVTLSGELHIPSAEGVQKFGATASEPIFEYRKPKRDEVPKSEVVTTDGYIRTRAIGYGSAVDRAQAALVRRLCAMAGLGLYLYDK